MPADEIFAAIKRAKKILLHFHPNPDPDSVGSALGMAHFLLGQNKAVTVIAGDSPLPDYLEFLPGHEQVLAKNYFEINPSEFDLFIILDSGGLDRVSILGPVIFPPALTTIVIDHHATTQPFGKINWLDSHYAATAEMLVALFTAWQVEITKAMAECLMLGIYTDTGGFKYPSVTADTFRAAATLATAAPDFHRLIFNLENNRRPEDIRFQALAFSSVKTYFGDRVAIAMLSHTDLVKNNLSQSEVGGVSIPNILKSVRGWDITVSLWEWEPGVVKLSARTRDDCRYDLTEFITKIGGGGHRAAAGAYLRLPLPAALDLVLAKLAEAYPDFAH